MLETLISDYKKTLCFGNFHQESSKDRAFEPIAGSSCINYKNFYNMNILELFTKIKYYSLTIPRAIQPVL